MSDYDGEIKLRLKVTPEGVKDAANKLSHELEEAVSTAGIEKMDVKMMKLANTMQKLQFKAARIVDEMQQLEDTKIALPEYADAQKQLSALDTQLNKTTEKLDNMRDAFNAQKDDLSDAIFQKQRELEQATTRYDQLFRKMTSEGLSQKESDELSALANQQREIESSIKELEQKLSAMNLEDSKTYQKLMQDLRAIAQNRAGLIAEIQRMENDGEAYTTGASTEKYQKLTEQLSLVNNEMRIVQEQMNNLQGQTESLDNTIETEAPQQMTLLQRLGATARNVLASVGNAVSSLHSKLSKQHPSSGFLHPKSLNQYIKLFLKWGLGIRSTFILIRKIRTAAKEGLKIMASYDSTLNSKIENLLTSLKRIKADVATILEPLVQTFTPILTNLLNKVHTVAVELAKFFAALVGQDYISVATVKNVDYADSLDNIADSANKASQALGSYDKLNVISKNTDSSADAKSTLALTKDTVQYVKQALDPNSWTVRLGKKVREIFDWIWEKLVAWKDFLSKQEWIQTIVTNLKEMLSDPESFLVLIGATLVVQKLASILTSAITGAMSLATAGKITIAAIVAIAGYKLGNKIFESLPEGLQDELGKTLSDIFDNPLEQLAENFALVGSYIFPEGLQDELGQTLLDIFDNPLEQLAENFSLVGETLKDAWDTAEDWLSDVLSPVFEGIHDFFTFDSGTPLDDLSEWWGEQADKIEERWEGVKKTFAGIWEEIKNIFSNVGTWFGNKFSAAWSAVTKAWSGTKKWFSDRWTGIKEVFGSVGTWFGTKFSGAWTAITTAWSGVKKWFSDKWAGIKEVFGNVGTWFSNKFSTAWTNIKNSWKDTKKWFGDKWTGIKEAFGDVKDWFTKKFTAAWTAIKEAFKNPKEFFSGVWSNIKNGFGDVKAWFKEKFEGAWSAITGAFKDPKAAFQKIWKSIKDGFGDVKKWFSDRVEDIKSPFEGIATWFQVKFTNAWNKITDVFGITKVKKFFSNLWEKITETFKDVGTKVGEAVGGAFKKVINTVLETVETVLNTPIRAINSLLGVINQVPGINIGKLDTLSLPRLAQGAVIPPNKEFLAVLGDQKSGTNIEAPLDTIVEAMKIALGSTGGRQDINLNIDGKRVAKVVWDETEKRYKQLGTLFA